jgi:hypothetical protein
MALMPEADIRLDVVAPGNYAPGQMGRVIGAIYHHIDGSILAAEAVWRTPGLQRSAHFGVDLDGHIIQWVDTRDVAYATCAGNWQGYVSIECASDPNCDDCPPTPAQIAAIGRIIAWLGTPPVPCSSMASGGVGYHRLFGGICSAYWGQTDCPGDGFADALPLICAAASGTTPQPEEDVKPVYIGKKSDPNQGIWITDWIHRRYVGPEEWAAANALADYAGVPRPQVFGIGDQWWDSIPVADPAGALTQTDLAHISAIVRSAVAGTGAGGNPLTKLVGTIDLNARTLVLTPTV